MIVVEGDHNSNRPRFLFDSATIFLVHILQVSVCVRERERERDI